MENYGILRSEGGGIMNTNREQMMNDVCRRLGLEHKLTITFCTMCEQTDVYDEVIEDFYNTIMVMDRYEE